MSLPSAAMPATDATSAAFAGGEEGPGWNHVSIDQYGPDGTTKISAVYFSVCPLCSALVPMAGDDGGEALRNTHEAFHFDMAKVMDRG